MIGKVTKLALFSRVVVIILQILSNLTIENHNPDVFRAPLNVINNSTDTKIATGDKIVDFLFGGLRHWDGEYFLHIAEYTYSYENTLAFYPLYPMIIRFNAKLLHSYIGLGFRASCLTIATILNILVFCQAANSLYSLTQRIFNDLNKSWNVALLFCLNPASIFFTAAYSESLYCWLTFSLMLECVSNLRLGRTILTLALSIVSRSNGLANIGFIIYFFMRKLILHSSQRILTILKLILCALSSLLPLTMFNFYAFEQFCRQEKLINHQDIVVSYARSRNYILAGQRQLQNSPWCDKLPLPFPYSYIQSHYWHVGFLQYYQFKQLPNFLLATPILTFLFYHNYKYLKGIKKIYPKYNFLQILKEFKSIPFVIHSLFLTIVCILFVHIQISTRLFCSATPCLYWFASDYLPKTFDQMKFRTKGGLILMWFFSYSIAGIILFSNNFPWT